MLAGHPQMENTGDGAPEYDRFEVPDVRCREGAAPRISMTAVLCGAHVRVVPPASAIGRLQLSGDVVETADHPTHKTDWTR
jgi:hypothetical protein